MNRPTLLVRIPLTGEGKHTVTHLQEVGFSNVSNRVVYVLDEDGTVTDGWDADDPTHTPNYEELIETVEAVRHPVGTVDVKGGFLETVQGSLSETVTPL